MLRQQIFFKNTMRTFLFTVVLHIGFVPAAHAQKLKDHSRVKEAVRLLEVWLQAKRDYDQIPGLSAAVVVDQEILWSGGFGLADPGRNIRANSETVYGICSISKLFTSIGVMQLRDKGKLELGDSVEELIPAYGIKQVFEDSAEVTVEGLLTHTAGLPANVDAPFSFGPEFEYPTRDDFLQLQGEMQTFFPAATTFEYSNMGMSLAGEIVARISDMSFESYVNNRILEPLNLNDTWTRLPTELLGTRMAVGFSAMDRNGSRSLVQPYQAKAYTPALGLASTVSDLAAFTTWQFRLLAGVTDSILESTTLQEMYRPHFTIANSEAAQGLGFEVDNVDGKIFVGHAGTCPGFVSRLLIETSSRIATIAMANANNVDIWNITSKMHEILAPAVEFARGAKPSDEDKKMDTPERVSGSGQRIVLSDYTGLYDAWPWNSDTAFIIWEGRLAALRLSSDDPVNDLRFWDHVSGDTFRKVRSDGQLAEPWIFHRDSSGSVDRVEVYGDYLRKID